MLTDDREVLWRVGMWWTWPNGNGSEANSIEVWADSHDAAIAQALAEVSAGRLGRSCAKQTPEITSCVMLTRAVTRADREQTVADPFAPYDPPGVEFYDTASGRTMKLVTGGQQFVGWLVFRHPDGQWVSLRRATDDEKARIAEGGTTDAD